MSEWWRHTSLQKCKALPLRESAKTEWVMGRFGERKDQRAASCILLFFLPPPPPCEAFVISTQDYISHLIKLKCTIWEYIFTLVSKLYVQYIMSYLMFLYRDLRGESDP